jgi:hypothetical protein
MDGSKVKSKHRRPKFVSHLRWFQWAGVRRSDGKECFGWETAKTRNTPRTMRAMREDLELRFTDVVVWLGGTDPMDAVPAIGQAHAEAPLSIARSQGRGLAAA